MLDNACFHHFQIVDAAVKQYLDRRGTDQGRYVLVGMARFLAAHYPTPRSVNRTFNIAVRLAARRRDIQRGIGLPGEAVRSKERGPRPV